MPTPYDCRALEDISFEFIALGAAGMSAFTQEKSVIFDVKGILPLGAADGRL